LLAIWLIPQYSFITLATVSSSTSPEGMLLLYCLSADRYFCTTRWSTDHRERKRAADRARRTSGCVLNVSAVFSQKTMMFMPCTLLEE